MTESYLNFAEQEAQRLNTEVEALQGEIRFQIETRDAWEKVLRDAGIETHAVCLNLATSEKERLSAEIETLREKIHCRIETVQAWNVVKQNAGNESRIYLGTTYVRGEDGQWDRQQLSTELDVLQVEVRLYNETKDAWDTILRNSRSESNAACLDIATSERERLIGQIEALQEKISCRMETKNAWDTTPRYAENETRVYQGATYVMGADRQWHLQQTEATESHHEELEAVGGWKQTTEADAAVDSVWQSFRGVYERVLGRTQKDIDLPAPDRGQFLSLGLN
ncbi:MAG: hypothetical protein ACRD3S_05140 [Terracidiphilus sp.]